MEDFPKQKKKKILLVEETAQAFAKISKLSSNFMYHSEKPSGQYIGLIVMSH
jgi:hypothetical protein